MTKEFRIDQTIRSDGKYVLNERIIYHSPRYGKTITIPEGRLSDGATGAMDITSRGWWVHDELCLMGKWDDGTPLNNWQCSQVLQDILTEEGRYWQGKRWFWATWLFGGGKARLNGLVCLLLCLMACGADAAILAQSPHTGRTEPVTSLTAAATRSDLAGSTIRVTSALSATMSNISSASLHKWPADRKLVVEKGGSIGNTTLFRFDDMAAFEAGSHRAFNGTGRISGLPESRPEWWGGIPDGVTDCSAAVNSAANASKHIRFGNGTYLMGPYTTNGTSEFGLILTSAHNNLRLSGNGRSSIIKSKSSAVGQNFFNIVMTSAKGVRIENLAFDGNADSQWDSNPATSVNGFMIIRFVPDADRAVDDIGITNCYFRGSFDSAVTSYGNSTATYPVGLTHHYYTSRVKITNCTFEDTGAHGVGMNEWVDSQVTGCTFTNVGRKPVISDIGSGMAVDVSAGCDHVVVSNNTVRSPYAIAGFKTETHYVSGNDYNYATNVIIEKNTINVGADYQFAYAIKASGKNITVRGNIIEQGYVHGINVARTTGGASPSVTENIIIEGNIVRDIKNATTPSAGSSYGIRADGGINVSIAGNQIFGTYPLSGIFVSSDNVTVNGNAISNDYATGSGIRTAGTNITVSNNTIKNTYIGINCGSSQSTVTGNIIYDDRTAASRVMIYGIFFAETVNMVRESDNVVLNAITGRYKYPSETAAAANEVSTTSNGFKSVFTGSPGGFYGTFTNGDVVYLNVVAAAGAHSYRCTTSGTILAGVYAITAGEIMGTITAGSKLLTVSGSEIAKLKPGQYVTIPGAGVAAADLKTRIDAIDSAGTTVTVVDAAVTTVGTPAQIAHTPFVLKSFGNLAP